MPRRTDAPTLKARVLRELRRHSLPVPTDELIRAVEAEGGPVPHVRVQIPAALRELVRAGMVRRIPPLRMRGFRKFGRPPASWQIATCAPAVRGEGSSSEIANRRAA